MYKIYQEKLCTYRGPLHKLLAIMRLTIGILVITFMHVSAASYGQRISLNEQKSTIENILRKIRTQTGYDFLYENKLIQNTDPITIKLNNETLDGTLKKLFNNLPLSYNIDGKIVVIKAKEQSFENKNTNLFSDIDVTGKIVDETGKSLKGATIRITDSEGDNKRVKIQYTASDAEGNFILKQVNEGSMMAISFMGYETKNVRATKNLGTITLKVAQASLGEVNVLSTGYQQVDKSKMTGATTTIKANDLVITGTTSIEQMLQGKIAGLEIVNNSGQVGRKQTVRLRGTSTMLGNQDPVWVIDGIIQEEPLPFKGSEINRFNQDPSNSQELKNFIGSAISWLNPYDIEEITVLKDAASTAIYGVKAANGVIVITTKRGKNGRSPAVSYTANFSTQQKPTYDKMNLMNSQQRIDVSREIWEKGLLSDNVLDAVGYSGVLYEYLYNKLPYVDFNAQVKQLEINNTDWFDLLFVTPLSQAHNLSISGGGNASTYYGSFGYNNNKGTAKGNNMDGYMANFNFTSYITPKLSVSTRLSGNYTTTTGFTGVDPYQYASKTSRVLDPFNDDGSLSYYKMGSGANYLGYNVLNELNNRTNDNTKTNINTAIAVKYELPLGFRLESTLGLGYTGTHAESYATEHTYEMSALRGYEYGMYGPTSGMYKSSKLPVGGRQSLDDQRNINYTWRNALNYSGIFNQKHVVSAMAGFELRSNIYKGASSTIYGYLPDRGKMVIPPPAEIFSNSSASAILIANPLYSNGNTPGFSYANVDQTSNYVSYYVTGAYSYDNRYVFSASLRGDASNRFGQDTRNRFNPIWALGARWNVAREHFFDKSSWFNDFSIRTSYGFQGNVAENYGPDLIANIPGGASAISNFTGEPILNIKTLPYANLRWEKTQTLNLGLDFSFFKSRVMASLDYYNKKSKDLIILKPIPYENGILQMPMNGGTLYNYGFEAQLTVIPVKTKNLTWSLSVNSAKNFNKVTSTILQNSSWDNARTGNYYVEGYPVSSFWVFDFTGLDSMNGTPVFNIPTTENNPKAKLDAATIMKYAGKLNADFTGGFGTNVNYKQLTFSTNVYASLGGHKLIAPLFTADMVNNTPNEYNNLSADLVNRWRKPGDEDFTKTPSIPSKGVTFITLPDGTTVSPYTLYNYSTARLVKASYLRINNISLSYLLPSEFAQKVFCKNLSLGYTFSNVHTFVSKDFKGVDPEVASGGQPMPKTHSFTLSATF